jgi:hypothetical protein
MEVANTKAIKHNAQTDFRIVISFFALQMPVP